MSAGKVVLGLLAGITAGAVLGILLAPEKGTDTRNKISKKGKDYTDSLKDKFTEFKATMTEKFDKVREDVSGYADQAESKANKMRKDVNTIQN